MKALATALSKTHNSATPMNIGPYHSLDKAFRVLELVAARSPRGVTEIADELGLEKSNVSRLLKTLSAMGYVVQSARRGQYQMGPRILVLAQGYLERDRIVVEAQPILRALAQEARATAHLGVIVEGQTIVVAKEPSPEQIQVATRVGARISPHASALGKVLLAGLPEATHTRALAGPLPRFTEKTITDRKKLLGILREVRRKGYAFESEEEHRGVGCIGAPVMDSSGRWIAALSVAGPLHGTPFRLNRSHLAMVLRKAKELSLKLSVAEDGPRLLSPTD
ncbi:MAG TPA: IclR family transcriptional regulator [Planctomycetota bacterium]|nr:IclR family transcriptional regulator [Planctomycetota bacterium]